jgi:hypothetical protein
VVLGKPWRDEARRNLKPIRHDKAPPIGYVTAAGRMGGIRDYGAARHEGRKGRTKERGEIIFIRVLGAVRKEQPLGESTAREAQRISEGRDPIG